MNTFFTLILTCLQCFLLSKSQVLYYNQKCHTPSAIENFNISRYLGKWYEIAKYPNFFQHGDCGETNIMSTNDRSQLIVLNKEVNNGLVWGTTGYIQVLEHGSSNMKLGIKTSYFGYRTTEYNILGTDYENWALVYACRNFGNNKLVNAWLFSRWRHLTENYENQVLAAISSSDLSLRQFQFTNHVGCPDLDSLAISYYYT